MKKLFTLIIVFASVLSLSAQGISFENHETTWTAVLKKAKTENKIVFVDAYATWCGPCKMMSNSIFPLKEVGDVFNKQFINVKMDMEKGEGPELSQKYGVMAYPTFLFVNGDGELVHRGLGGMAVDKFIALGQSASDPEKQFFSLKKKYESGERSADFLKKFAYSCQDAQETVLIPKVAGAYLATQKDWLTPNNMDFILKFTSRVDDTTFAFMVKNQAAFEQSKGKQLVSKQIYQIALENVARSSFNRETRELDLNKAKEFGAKYMTQEMLDKILSNMALIQYEMKDDLPKALVQAIAFFDKYPSDDPQELNQYAWIFYEKSDDKAQLEKALTWALKSISISDEYAFNDTAAALYFKLGNKSKAKEFAMKAIQQAKETNYDSTETEALLKRIDAM